MHCCIHAFAHEAILTSHTCPMHVRFAVWYGTYTLTCPEPSIHMYVANTLSPTSSFMYCWWMVGSKPCGCSCSLRRDTTLTEHAEARRGVLRVWGAAPFLRRLMVATWYDKNLENTALSDILKRLGGTWNVFWITKGGFDKSTSSASVLWVWLHTQC